MGKCNCKKYKEYVWVAKGERYCYNCGKYVPLSSDIRKDKVKRRDTDLKDHNDPKNPFRLDIGGEG